MDTAPWSVTLSTQVAVPLHLSPGLKDLQGQWRMPHRLGLGAWDYGRERVMTVSWGREGQGVEEEYPFRGHIFCPPSGHLAGGAELGVGAELSHSFPAQGARAHPFFLFFAELLGQTCARQCGVVWL